MKAGDLVILKDGEYEKLPIQDDYGCNLFDYLGFDKNDRFKIVEVFIDRNDNKLVLDPEPLSPDRWQRFEMKAERFELVSEKRDTKINRLL